MTVRVLVWLLMFVWLAASPPSGWADDPSVPAPEDASAAPSEGVLAEPSATLDETAAVVNRTAPGISQLYDVRNGEWYTGTSLALWTFQPDQAPLASLRAGYAVDYKVYGEAQADVLGLATKYVVPNLPASVASVLGYGVLDSVWSALGKYGTVGGFLGWDFDREKEGDEDAGGFIGGASFGAKVTF